MNIIEILIKQAKLQPNALAVRRSGVDLTYKNFAEYVLNLANGLDELAIKPGDIVGIALRDTFEHWCACLALAHRGAIVFSISKSMPKAQLTKLLSLTKCKKVLVDHEQQSSIYGLSIQQILWSQVKKQPQSIKKLSPIERADQPWIYVTGSGSTGHPKIIPINHRIQLYRSTLAKDWAPYSNQDVLLSLVGIHFYAAKQRYLEALSLGAAIFIGSPEQLDHYQEVKNREITAIYGTVFHLRNLINSIDQEDLLYYANLKSLMIGGSSVPMGFRDDIRRRITENLYVLWGSNESHTSTMTDLDSVFVLENTVGHSFPGVKIEIVDRNGSQLPLGVNGEIRISSDLCIKGYLSDSQATKKSFREGWFYPGDIGHIASDGQLVHCGRSDNMMIVNGINIYPSEIENCLLTFPGVDEVLATGLKYQQYQDIPMALVVQKADTKLDKDALLNRVRNHLGQHSLFDVILVDSIPKNELGKIDSEIVNKILTMRLHSRRENQERLLKQSEANQKSNTIIFSFSPPLGAKPGILNDWLELLDKNLALSLCNEDCRNPDNSGMAWLKEVLALTLGLLHVMRIPLFDHIQISECSIKKNKNDIWNAVCVLPDRNLIAESVFQQVLKIAFRISNAIFQLDIHEVCNKDLFFKLIDINIIKRFAKQQPNGKSTFEMLRVAHQHNIPYMPMPGGTFQIGYGIHSRMIDRSTTDKDSVMGMMWANNKLISSMFLRKAGLPSPKHIKVDSIETAQKAANLLKYPVVIKPADLERGEGVNVNVQTGDVAKAFEDALGRSPKKLVLVEQQIPGVCHRLFIVAGELLYAVKRLPIGVYADGQSTINDLVNKEYSNQKLLPPWKRSGILPLDKLAHQVIAEHGWGPESIPEKDKFIALRAIETTAWGGIDEDVTREIHPDNLEAAVLAAQIFRLEVAGVDIISTDISKPWHKNGAVINEVNFAPLLGGGEISRAHIPEYFSRIIKNSGKIPITAYMSSDDFRTQALAKRQKLCNKGVSVYLVENHETVDPEGKISYFSSNSLELRVMGLLMQKKVEALIIIMKSTEEKESIRRLIKGVEFI